MPFSSLSLCISLSGLLLFAAPQAFSAEYQLSGPYTHENLLIYLIHGKQHAGKAFLTLQEAMDQKKVVVYETGNVNQLSVENLSQEDIFIQSGDIVKGGRQDRVFPDDFVLPTRSGKVPISSFCVEHGRWTRRGAEAADHFNTSNDLVATKALKLAARGSAGQSEVWKQVERAQARLAWTGSGNLATASPTSMQLALESKPVKDATGGYLRALEHAIDGKPDVIGYAFAINGKLSGADIYTSSDLFRKMWPKLVKAGAVEAVAERSSTKPQPAPDAAEVQRVLADAERGRESSKDVARRLQVLTKETDKAVLFETRDKANRSEWLHKAYVVK